MDSQCLPRTRRGERKLSKEGYYAERLRVSTQAWQWGGAAGCLCSRVEWTVPNPWSEISTGGPYTFFTHNLRLHLSRYANYASCSLLLAGPFLSGIIGINYFINTVLFWGRVFGGVSDHTSHGGVWLHRWYGGVNYPKHPVFWLRGILYLKITCAGQAEWHIG